MTQFDDRERDFDIRFERDEEMQFRIMARRNRLLAEWAARQMELSEVETEAYAKDVVRADFEEAGDENVVRKVLGDLIAAGVDGEASLVRDALGDKLVEARRQIIEQTNL
jgi:hypothetical protein